nr:ferric reductase-like transmembrane domain-containing protein [uncultured Desulfobulbus sp.]
MQQNRTNPYPNASITRRSLVIASGALFLATVLSVPFYYPTETLWYKLGVDKLLLQVGQFAGLLTLALLVVQVLLALRPEVLAKSFSPGSLLRWHRGNGIALAVLAVSHVLLVLAPEGIANLPIGREYWPEMLGAAGLVLLLATVLLSQFRTQMKLSFAGWSSLHRPMGYGLFFLVTLHILFVSESFQGGLPRYGLITVSLLVFATAAGSWVHRSHRSS